MAQPMKHQRREGRGARWRTVRRYVETRYVRSVSWGEEDRVKAVTLTANRADAFEFSKPTAVKIASQYRGVAMVTR